MLNRTMSARGLVSAWLRPKRAKTNGFAFGGKKVLIAGFAILLLSGCGGPKAPEAKKADVFTSIKDAITRSITLRCDYKDDNGKVTVTYIKGQVIRMMADENVKDDAMNVNSLIKDNKMYVWASESKDGMLIDMAAKQNANDTNAGNTKIQGTDDIINDLEQEKNNCRQENAPDSIFEVPMDINFKDFSSLGL